jgi:cytochrome c553
MGRKDTMKRVWAIFAGVIFASAAAAANAADVAAGESRYQLNCVNCHGAGGQGMASFPGIQGRDAAYITEKLETYRAREMVGPNSAIMMSLAGDLSDEDIANLAAFIEARFN